MAEKAIKRILYFAAMLVLICSVMLAGHIAYAEGTDFGTSQEKAAQDGIASGDAILGDDAAASGDADPQNSDAGSDKGKTDYRFSTADAKDWEQVDDNTWKANITSGDSTITVVLKMVGDKWTYTFEVPDGSGPYYVYEEGSTDEEGKYHGKYLKIEDGTIVTMPDAEADGYTYKPVGKGSWNLPYTGVYPYTDEQTGGDIEITNKSDDPRPDTGNLSIYKQVVGSEVDSSFLITITLKSLAQSTGTDGASGNGTDTGSGTGTGSDSNTPQYTKISGQYGDVIFRWDEATHTAVGTAPIRDEQTIDVTGLPTGTTYSIEEQAAAGFNASYEGQTGTIDTNQTSYAVITNTFTPDTPEPDGTPGGFTIRKAGKGAIYEDEKFGFQIHMDGLPGKTSYNIQYPEVTDGAENEIDENEDDRARSYSTDASGNADLTIYLKKDEIASLTGLPAGITYRITEDGGDYKSSYQATVSEGGQLGTSKGSNQNTNQDLSTGEETVDSGEMTNFVFTNERDSGTLKITKKVSGNMANRHKDFQFYLYLTKDGKPYTRFSTLDAKLYPEADTPETVLEQKKQIEDKPLTLDTEKGRYPFTLRHDQKLVIPDLPAGILYEVKEDPETAEGYQLEATGTKGKITGDGAQADFVNKKDVSIATGITSTGYTGWMILILGGALIAYILVKRRRNQKDIGKEGVR